VCTCNIFQQYVMTKEESVLFWRQEDRRENVNKIAMQES
jgi:hypothetical protein